MLNFSYYNPVRVIFGKDTIQQLTELIPLNSRILMTYGGGSIMKNGVYAKVKKALTRHTVLEFPGIEPNPAYETCMKAVEVVKKEKIDFLLAVGGGSVLDGTKFIAAASKFEGGDPWDILAKAAPVKSALPIGCVITLPATGSEMNSYSVVSKKATHEKLAFMNEHVFPKFSIIDPTTTFSLPRNQVANGLADSYIHALEQYLTYDVNSPLQDRQTEAILKTLIDIAQDTLNRPEDYATRSNFFWCATHALNGMAACGVPVDWATHQIGHELTALYGLDHGVTLSIVLPQLLRKQKAVKKAKLLQYGERIFGIKESNPDSAIEKAIIKTEEYFRSLGMKMHLADYNISSKDAAEKVSERFRSRNSSAGVSQPISPEDVKAILLNC